MSTVLSFFLLSIYLIVLVILLCIGAHYYNDPLTYQRNYSRYRYTDEERENNRQFGARMMLFSPAWPLVIPLGVGYLVFQLLKFMFFKFPKGIINVAKVAFPK